MAADTPSRSDSTDSKPLSVTRIYTGSDGETHFGSFTIQMKGSGTRVAATQLHFTCYNAPINVSPHLPPPGAGWGIFLVWNGRFAPGVGILNR